MHNIQPVILLGGSCTGLPKQFLCLTGEQSFFVLAATRLAGLAAPDIEVAPPLIVTNEECRFLAPEQ